MLAKPKAACRDCVAVADVIEEVFVTGSGSGGSDQDSYYFDVPAMVRDAVHDLTNSATSTPEGAGNGSTSGASGHPSDSDAKEPQAGGGNDAQGGNPGDQPVVCATCTALEEMALADNNRRLYEAQKAKAIADGDAVKVQDLDILIDLEIDNYSRANAQYGVDYWKSRTQPPDNGGP